MSSETIQDTGDHHYREDVPYMLPKSLEEDERLTLQHLVFRHALKGNYIVPLDKNPTHILDVGSGSSAWGREIALQFPSASVFGLDLEPVSSSGDASSLPPNYHFVQGNVLQGLPFPNDTFDFTHQRMLVAGIPAPDWPRVVQELARVTRPGGWIELLEACNTIVNSGPATKLLYQWFQDLCLSRGVDLSQTEKISMWLTQAGLKQVTQQTVDIPLGQWDTQVGVLLERDFLTAYEAVKPAICRQAQITLSAFDQHLAMTLQEWKEQQVCQRFYLAYGQV